MEKLLVFIDTGKFKGLVNCPQRLTEINFTKTIPGPSGDVKVDLRDNDILAIGDSGITAIDISGISTHDARIFIIPDQKINRLIKGKQPIPEFEFKLLHHTGTENYPAALSLLKQKSIGYEQSIEERDTVYHELANMVCNKALNATIIYEFIEKIKVFDTVLEAKLNFLHKCLTPEGLADAELMISEDWDASQEFSNLNDIEADGPFGENYLSALRNLRNQLLPPATV
jgi:hypothetical protein